MDAASLRALIDGSREELETLHARLGSPADELVRTMAALNACIHEAIQDKVRGVRADVAREEDACAALRSRIAALHTATGSPGLADAGAAPRAPTLRAQRVQLADTEAALRAAYTAQREQCRAVVEQIRMLNKCMSDAGGQPGGSADWCGNGADAAGADAADADAADADAGDAAGAALVDVSGRRRAALEAHLQHTQQVYAERKMQMEAQLGEILQLWSELQVAPCVAVQEGRVVPREGGAADEAGFHAAVLQYTQQVPVLSDGGFDGSFVLSADEDHVPDNLLQPTDATLAQSTALRETLETEKTAREAAIQAQYDELCELWIRFDVPEAEMDAFVHEHRGSTLAVVDAYNVELEKMRALKSQHMTLFIAKTREQIAAQWDALFMAESERRSMFPAFFCDLPATDSAVAPAHPAFDWDDILAQHEQMYAALNEMLEQRAPLLALIGRYREICDEARALEESANDAARLLGRGNRGDPGRLLREERMRKRVRVQKPKVEQELLRALPSWEAEHNMPFLMDGVRFVDTLRDQLGGAKENMRNVRPRTGSADETRPGSRKGNPVPATPAPGVKRAPAHVDGTVRRAAAPVGRARVATRPPAAPTDAPWIRGQRGATPRSATPGTAAAALHTPGLGARVDRASMETTVHSSAQRTPSTYLTSSLSGAPHW
ncbi:putative protein kinase YGL059W [Malassezia sp. CBS 17886]|nr:putative protein kinase YGL059W [Malassezia sp. CBS 17886]